MGIRCFASKCAVLAGLEIFTRSCNVTCICSCDGRRLWRYAAIMYTCIEKRIKNNKSQINTDSEKHLDVPALTFCDLSPILTRQHWHWHVDQHVRRHVDGHVDERHRHPIERHGHVRQHVDGHVGQHARRHVDGHVFGRRRTFEDMSVNTLVDMLTDMTAPATARVNAVMINTVLIFQLAGKRSATCRRTFQKE